MGRKNPRTSTRHTKRWEVALLSPYQANAVAFGTWSASSLACHLKLDLIQSNAKPSPIMLVVNSSHRFQGQEADVVFLSLKMERELVFLTAQVE